MAGNISIFTSCVAVFGEIGVPPLTKRLNDFATVGFDKDGIPFFLGIMGALDGFQVQSSRPHCTFYILFRYPKTDNIDIRSISKV
jgi:hypothetical protein